MKLYGRSLSFCVQDILSGRVSLDDVQCIITSTKLESFDDFKICISQYLETYWVAYPENQVRGVCYYLWFTGRIIQPRLKHTNHMQNLAGCEFWSHSIRDCVNSLMFY